MLDVTELALFLHIELFAPVSPTSYAHARVTEEILYIVEIEDRYIRNDGRTYGKYIYNIIMTGFGKTLRMGFFQKIEFDAWLISSSIELTRVQVLGRSRASLLRYSALFAIAPHPQ